jgi:hypothetical protein
MTTIQECIDYIRKPGLNLGIFQRMIQSLDTDDVNMVIQNANGTQTNILKEAILRGHIGII